MPSSSELVLLARVARRYYLDDRSKSDIADELGLSRFKVARMLDAARREGVVTIRVESQAGIDTDLSARLQTELGLDHAVVVDHGSTRTARGDAAALRARLGEVAAEVLGDVVAADDVLGLAWARSLLGIGEASVAIPPCPVIQLTGAMPGPDGRDVIDLVRRVARAGGGSPHVFYAPFVAPDAVSARTLRRQPEVARTLELAERVSVAAVGVGAWAPGLSTIYDALDEADRDRAARAGAVAEISGAIVDASGAPVAPAITRRIIGVTVEQLRRARCVISVAYGAEKAEAVRAVVGAGLVTGLVTHTDLARRLLDDA